MALHLTEPAPPTPVRLPARLPALDGLRGFAVLLVFLVHYGGGAQSSHPLIRTFGVAVKAGWCGVTLFFVLSGFLITGILADSFDHPRWARNFYMRRVLRIFPLYYATILILILAGVWQSAFRPTLRTAAIFAAFCQNIPLFTLPAKVAAPVYHLGSIAVEEQFYLLWPAIFFLLRRRRAALIACACAFLASFLFRILAFAHAPDPELYMGTLFARGGELAVGCGLALLYRGPHWRTLQRAAPAACLGFLAAFLLASRWSGSFGLHNRIEWLYALPAITLCFAALLVWATSPGGLQHLASTGWLRWLGRISYGIYVFHLLLVHFINLAAAHAAHAHAGNLYEALRFLIAAAATLAVSWFSYRLFERRFLRLKRFFPSPPAVPAPDPRPTVLLN